MNELHLALSYGAVQALAQGDELVFDIGEGGDAVRVILCCDDDALVTFKERIEQAMLHLLPVGTEKH